MPLDLKPIILLRLADVFPDARDRQAAQDALNQITEPRVPAADAVKLAILKRGDGQLWRLRELGQAARRDFRDVLYPAQQDQASWISWITSPPR